MRYLNVLILIAMAMVALAGHAMGLEKCEDFTKGKNSDETIANCDECCENNFGHSNGKYSTWPSGCWC